MREEAFEGYVNRAKRKAQSLKKQQQQLQQQQKQKQKNPLKQEKKPADGESGWTASLPGWVTSRLADVTAEVDEWYDWLTDEENDNNENTNEDDEDDIDYRQTQFWELAKLEGDQKWIEWLETHIWTVSLFLWAHDDK